MCNLYDLQHGRSRVTREGYVSYTVVVDDGCYVCNMIVQLSLTSLNTQVCLPVEDCVCHVEIHRQWISIVKIGKPV